MDSTLVSETILIYWEITISELLLMLNVRDGTKGMDKGKLYFTVTSTMSPGPLQPTATQVPPAG